MAPIENQLIASLPIKDGKRLLLGCDLIELKLSDVLYESGDLTRHVYFPTDSFISLLALGDDQSGVEVGMIGREGLLGSHLALGVSTSPLRALVQGAGESLRIGRVAFLAELDRSVALRRTLNLYLHTLMVQLATSAACLRYHEVGPRLARWLLMSQDRARSDHFLMTHEFLSTMLGVRRVGITMAAGALQRAGLIEYQRGEITILNRKGLQAMSCRCYETDRQSYRATMDRE